MKIKKRNTINLTCYLFKQWISWIFSLAGILLIYSSCSTSSRFSSQKKEEIFTIKVLEDNSFLDFPAKLAQNENSRDASRGGFLIPILGSAVSYATSGIKNMISHERSKFVSSYSSNRNDLYFYNNLSFTDNLDPSGITFKGIEICRTIKYREKIDTALYAVFYIERSKAEELVNNSTFRLVLDTVNVKYARAKVSSGYWFMPWTYLSHKNCKFDLDIEIRISSSWVTENTQIFDNVRLGNFICQLRDIPLGGNSDQNKSYFSSLQGKEISGKCFIVPRSFGHVKQAEEMKPCYGQGLYNVEVNIRESSKSKYLKLPANNSDQLINFFQQYIYNKAYRYLPGW